MSSGVDLAGVSKESRPASRWRSGLFGAATRVGFIEKAQSVGADFGILDLEDAVPEAGKAEARDTLRAVGASSIDRGELALMVRVNGLATPHFLDDLAAAAVASADGVVVPMLVSAADVHFARGAMAMAGLGDALMIGGVETARGLLAANEICAAGLDAVYLGAEDFVTDLGGTRTASNHEVAVARAQLAFAARAANVVALDQVVVDFSDHERFDREADEAANLGFGGKLCIHPAQVARANRAFSPSDAAIADARRVIEAAEAAAAGGSGLAVVDGQMIDEPIIVRARRLLELGGVALADDETTA